VEAFSIQRSAMSREIPRKRTSALSLVIYPTDSRLLMPEGKEKGLMYEKG